MTKDGAPPRFLHLLSSMIRPSLRRSTQELTQALAMGQDAGTQVVDPRFVDPAKDDYRLQADSPALALGFAPDAAGKAGLYEDPERASWPAGAVTKP